MPADQWDFSKFYSEKPDTDLFLCKALVAGAIGIYLEVVNRQEMVRPGLSAGEESSIQRVIQVFNAFLRETRGGKENPADFDPFSHDEYLKRTPMPDRARREYEERVKELFAAFEKEFGVRDCVEILGFDPFRYEEYDEETQERIEEGEWMQKCSECMENVIQTMSDGG